MSNTELTRECQLRIVALQSATQFQGLISGASWNEVDAVLLRADYFYTWLVGKENE